MQSACMNLSDKGIAQLRPLQIPRPTQRPGRMWQWEQRQIKGGTVLRYDKHSVCGD